MTGPCESRAGFLGLGSNLGQRRDQLRAGLEGLADGGVQIDAVSSLYETAPVGEYEGPQPDFLNLVAAIRTALGPHELLGLCKAIEADCGRRQGGPRHGPRPLDIDILTLGGIELDTPQLKIPHAAMTERRFVLEPLLELDAAATLPDGTRLASLLAELPPERVERAGRLSR